MGIFDSIYANLTCPICDYSDRMEVQVKFDPCMRVYEIGDTVDWEGIIDLTVQDTAMCPQCYIRIETIRKRVDQKLRVKFGVPDSVELEFWSAWPDGTPILPATTLEKIYANKEIPTFEVWLEQHGFGKKQSGMWMTYLEKVLRPYLVTKNAPDGWLMYTHPNYKDIKWRNLMTEEMDKLRDVGEVPQSGFFPVILDVKDRVIKEVRVA